MSDYITRGQAIKYIEYAIIELNNLTYYNNTHIKDKIRKAPEISTIPHQNIRIKGNRERLTEIAEVQMKENSEKVKTLTEYAQYEIKVKIEEIVKMHYNSTCRTEVSELKYSEFEQYYNKICQLAEVLQLDIFKEMANKQLKQTETWTAREDLKALGGEVVFFVGAAVTGGIATVTFTNVDNPSQTFVQRYKMLSTYTEGLSVALGGSRTITTHTREFLIDALYDEDGVYKGKEADNLIKESFEGTSRSFGVSGSIGPLSTYVGGAYAVNEKTGKRNYNNWSGVAGGHSLGVGLPLGITIEQECVYILDNGKDRGWSNPDVDKYFYRNRNKGGN